MRFPELRQAGRSRWTPVNEGEGGGVGPPKHNGKGSGENFVARTLRADFYFWGVI